MPLVELDLHPSRPALRTFGLIAVVAFGLVGAVIRWKGGFLFWNFPDAAPVVANVLWIVGGVSGLFAFVFPAANLPLYATLMIVSLPIGLVVSFAILGLLFYGLMMPLNLIFRLIGRDAMDRRFDRGATSYWKTHAAPARVDRYFKQF